MCCFVGGVSSFFARGEKKQNKFPRNAPPYQRRTKLINPFFVIISIKFQCVVSVFYTCLQRFGYGNVGQLIAPPYHHAQAAAFVLGFNLIISNSRSKSFGGVG
jgi:hypothetical protein